MKHTDLSMESYKDFPIMWEKHEDGSYSVMTPAFEFQLKPGANLNEAINMMFLHLYGDDITFH